MKMILNPNIIIFEHTECVLLFNQKNKNVYKIGIKEYDILLHFLKSDGKKEDLFFENNNLSLLFNNFTKNNILVEENYIEPKVKKFIKTFWLSKDKKHINDYKKFPEVVLYLFVPTFIFCIFFVYLNFDGYKLAFSFFKEHKIFTVIMLEFATLISTFVHEVWHMLIAHNEGADVPQIGIKFAYVLYWFYVKIIGISLLEKQSKIKIYMAYGDSDKTVPYEENGIALERKYKECGVENLLYIDKKIGVDHHPHGPSDIEFAINYMKKW